MPENSPPPLERDDAFAEFRDCACSGDLEGMRALVAAGLALTERRVIGQTALEILIDDLVDSPKILRCEVVREMLRLGADARQKNTDGFGPLFSAVLTMDADLLRVLMEAGADPNAEEMDSIFESLYDWAEFDYRYHVWGLNAQELAEVWDTADEDAWVRNLDRLALEHGRQRPEHLQVLRQHGALSMRELRPSDKSCNEFELRLDAGFDARKRLTDGKITLHTGIWIDGHHLDEPHVIDFRALVRSLHAEGWHEIFTCECGDAGCAGIADGIRVTHKSGMIQWSLCRPQRSARFRSPVVKPVVFVFDHAQMLNAVLTYLEAVRSRVGSHPNEFAWPVYGLNVEDVLRIDPTAPEL